MRDTNERGRQLEQVLTQYTKLVKPAFEEFCLPVSTNDFMIHDLCFNNKHFSLISSHVKLLDIFVYILESYKIEICLLACFLFCFLTD